MKSWESLRGNFMRWNFIFGSHTQFLTMRYVICVNARRERENISHTIPGLVRDSTHVYADLVVSHVLHTQYYGTWIQWEKRASKLKSKTTYRNSIFRNRNGRHHRIYILIPRTSWCNLCVRSPHTLIFPFASFHHNSLSCLCVLAENRQTSFFFSPLQVVLEVHYLSELTESVNADHVRIMAKEWRKEHNIEQNYTTFHCSPLLCHVKVQHVDEKRKNQFERKPQNSQQH